MQVATTVDGDNGMVVKRLSVPIGLEELMESLTKQVLLKKPADVYSFASNHFAHLLSIRDEKMIESENKSSKKIDNKSNNIKIKSATVATKFNKLPTPIIFTNCQTVPQAITKKFANNKSSKVTDTSPRSMASMKSTSSDNSQLTDTSKQGRVGRARWKKQEIPKRKPPLEKSTSSSPTKKQITPRKNVKKEPEKEPPRRLASERYRARKNMQNLQKSQEETSPVKRALSKDRVQTNNSINVKKGGNLSKSSSVEEDSITINGSSVNLRNKSKKKAAVAGAIAGAAGAVVAAGVAVKAGAQKITGEAENISEACIESGKMISCPEKFESDSSVAEITDSMLNSYVEPAKIQIKDDAVDSDFVDEDDKESVVVENINYIQQEHSLENNDAPESKELENLETIPENVTEDRKNEEIKHAEEDVKTENKNEELSKDHADKKDEAQKTDDGEHETDVVPESTLDVSTHDVEAENLEQKHEENAQSEGGQNQTDDVKKEEQNAAMNSMTDSLQEHDVAKKEQHDSIKDNTNDEVIDIENKADSAKIEEDLIKDSNLQTVKDDEVADISKKADVDENAAEDDDKEDNLKGTTPNAEEKLLEDAPSKEEESQSAYESIQKEESTSENVTPIETNEKSKATEVITAENADLKVADDVTSSELDILESKLKAARAEASIDELKETSSKENEIGVAKIADSSEEKVDESLENEVKANEESNASNEQEGDGVKHDDIKKDDIDTAVTSKIENDIEDKLNTENTANNNVTIDDGIKDGENADSEKNQNEGANGSEDIDNDVKNDDTDINTQNDTGIPNGEKKVLDENVINENEVHDRTKRSIDSAENTYEEVTKDGDTKDVDTKDSTDHSDTQNADEVERSKTENAETAENELENRENDRSTSADETLNDDENIKAILLKSAEENKVIEEKENETIKDILLSEDNKNETSPKHKASNEDEQTNEKKQDENIMQDNINNENITTDNDDKPNLDDSSTSGNNESNHMDPELNKDEAKASLHSDIEMSDGSKVLESEESKSKNEIKSSQEEITEGTDSNKQDDSKVEDDTKIDEEIANDASQEGKVNDKNETPLEIKNDGDNIEMANDGSKKEKVIGKNEGTIEDEIKNDGGNTEGTIIDNAKSANGTEESLQNEKVGNNNKELSDENNKQLIQHPDTVHVEDGKDTPSVSEKTENLKEEENIIANISPNEDSDAKSAVGTNNEMENEAKETEEATVESASITEIKDQTLMEDNSEDTIGNKHLPSKANEELEVDSKSENVHSTEKLDETDDKQTMNTDKEANEPKTKTADSTMNSQEDKIENLEKEGEIEQQSNSISDSQNENNVLTEEKSDEMLLQELADSVNNFQPNITDEVKMGSDIEAKDDENYEENEKSHQSSTLNNDSKKENDAISEETAKENDIKDEGNHYSVEEIDDKTTNNMQPEEDAKKSDVKIEEVEHNEILDDKNGEEETKYRIETPEDKSETDKNTGSSAVENDDGKTKGDENSTDKEAGINRIDSDVEIVILNADGEEVPHDAEGTTVSSASPGKVDVDDDGPLHLEELSQYLVDQGKIPEKPDSPTTDEKEETTIGEKNEESTKVTMQNESIENVKDDKVEDNVKAADDKVVEHDDIKVPDEDSDLIEDADKSDGASLIKSSGGEGDVEATTAEAGLVNNVEDASKDNGKNEDRATTSEVFDQSKSSPETFGQLVEPSAPPHEDLSAPQQNAATKIQSLWRGHKIRKVLREQQMLNLQKPAECDELPHQRGFSGDDTIRAATVIQSFIRGHLVRKEIMKAQKNVENPGLDPLIEENEEREVQLTDDQVEDALNKLDTLVVPNDDPVAKPKKDESGHNQLQSIDENASLNLDASNEIIDTEGSKRLKRSLNVDEKEDSNSSEEISSKEDSNTSIFDSISEKMSELKKSFLGSHDKPDEVEEKAVEKMEDNGSTEATEEKKSFFGNISGKMRNLLGDSEKSKEDEDNEITMDEVLIKDTDQNAISTIEEGKHEEEIDHADKKDDKSISETVSEKINNLKNFFTSSKESKGDKEDIANESTENIEEKGEEDKSILGNVSGNLNNLENIVTGSKNNSKEDEDKTLTKEEKSDSIKSVEVSKLNDSNTFIANEMSNVYANPEKRSSANVSGKAIMAGIGGLAAATAGTILLHNEKEGSLDQHKKITGTSTEDVEKNENVKINEIPCNDDVVAEASNHVDGESQDGEGSYDYLKIEETADEMDSGVGFDELNDRVGDEIDIGEDADKKNENEDENVPTKVKELQQGSKSEDVKSNKDDIVSDDKIRHKRSTEEAEKAETEVANTEIKENVTLDNSKTFLDLEKEHYDDDKNNDTLNSANETFIIDDNAKKTGEDTDVSEDEIDNTESMSILNQIKNDLHNMKNLITNGDDDVKTDEDEDERPQTVLKVSRPKSADAPKKVEEDEDDRPKTAVDEGDEFPYARLVSNESTMSLDSAVTTVMTDDFNATRIIEDLPKSPQKTDDNDIPKSPLLNNEETENNAEEIVPEKNILENTINDLENNEEKNLIITSNVEENNNNENIKFLANFISAATKIQSHYRGYRVRNKRSNNAEEDKNMLNKVIANIEMQQNEELDKIIHNENEEATLNKALAAIKIQRMFKAFIERKKFNEETKGDSLASEKMDDTSKFIHLEKEHYDVSNDSAKEVKKKDLAQSVEQIKNADSVKEGNKIAMTETTTHKDNKTVDAITIKDEGMKSDDIAEKRKDIKEEDNNENKKIEINDGENMETEVSMRAKEENDNANKVNDLTGSTEKNGETAKVEAVPNDDSRNIEVNKVIIDGNDGNDKTIMESAQVGHADETDIRDVKESNNTVEGTRESTTEGIDMVSTDTNKIEQKETDTNAKANDDQKNVTETTNQEKDQTNVDESTLKDKENDGKKGDNIDSVFAAVRIQRSFKRYLSRQKEGSKSSKNAEDVINIVQGNYIHSGVQEYIESVIDPTLVHHQPAPKKASLGQFIRSLADPKTDLEEIRAKSVEIDERVKTSLEDLAKTNDMDKLKAKSEEIEQSVKSSIKELEELTQQIDDGIGSSSRSTPFYLHEPDKDTDNPIAAAIRVSSKVTNQEPNIGMLHSGEFHDTIPLNFSPTKIQVLVQDQRSPIGSPPAPVLLHSGEMHDGLVQQNDPPAGAAPVTSVNGDVAHASPRDGSARTPAESQESPVPGMEEKRNNAAIIEKNMETQAATKIQASFRGYQVRKQLNKPKAANEGVTTRRSARRKNSKADSKKVENLDLEERSATKIQAGIRGFLVRRRQKGGKKDDS